MQHINNSCTRYKKLHERRPTTHNGRAHVNDIMAQNYIQGKLAVTH